MNKEIFRYLNLFQNETYIINISFVKKLATIFLVIYFNILFSCFSTSYTGS